MKKTKKTINANLEEAQINALRNLREKTGAPVSVLIRRAVNDFLKGGGKREKR